MTKEKLISRVHIFTAALLILQPLLDVVSFWFDKAGLSPNITLALRLLVLAITVLYAFAITGKRKVYYIAVGVIILVYAAHIFACWQADPGVLSAGRLFADIANYIRVIQMPLIAICLITFLQSSKHSYTGLQYGLSIAFLIMLAVMLIATVTDTDPHTYKDGKGVLGWFNNTNSQSSNLCVLLPISLGWQITWKKFMTVKNQIIFWLTCICGLIAMYVFCTRLAYLGIVAATAGIAIVLLFTRSKTWIASLKSKNILSAAKELSTSIALLILCGIFIILIPVSPMTRHINNDYEYLNKTVQTWADDKVEDLDKVEELKEQEKEDQSEENKAEIEAELVDQLKILYEWKAADFVQIFGLEKTMEMYDYTTDVNVFSDLRAKKITFGKMLMNDSPFTSRLFGLEISRFTVNTETRVETEEGRVFYRTTENIYDVENDFHGVYFLYGWLGLGAYILFLGYFAWLVIKALLNNVKKYFTIEAAGFGIALLLCLAHAYNTAGVLRRPNASVFLAATLAGIYYLVKIKEYEEPHLPEKKKK